MLLGKVIFSLLGIPQHSALLTLSLVVLSGVVLPPPLPLLLGSQCPLPAAAGAKVHAPLNPMGSTFSGTTCHTILHSASP